MILQRPVRVRLPGGEAVDPWSERPVRLYPVSDVKVFLGGKEILGGFSAESVQYVELSKQEKDA